MKTRLKTDRHLKKSVFHYNCTEFLKDGEHGLYVEDYFNEMLCLERKRSERTERPFTLVLVSINEQSAQEAISAIASSVASIARETDIKGWYRHNRVVGAILVDTGLAGAERFREKLLSEFASREASVGEVSPGISMHQYPETGPGGLPQADLTLYPDLEKAKAAKKKTIAAKRAMDIAGSLLGLALFSPLLLAIPLFLKASSKGPVLFRQTRIGESGRPFTFLKFRSMRYGASDNIHSDYIKRLIREDSSYATVGGNGKVYKIKDDPRITAFGRFLRKTSLDELPQFINVLMGDMSLVGPRPPIPYELESYRPWHRRRVMEARPGITGLWQVTGRSMTSYNDMVRLDIRYIERWSLRLDLKIILLTPFSMVSRKGAY